MTARSSDLDDTERAALPAAWRDRFVALPRYRSGVVPRHGRGRAALRAALGTFLSDYDVNGLLGTYAMSSLTTAEWRVLLGDAARGRLLDVGAGAGGVTAELAPLFAEVVTTETSRAMAIRLRRRGWRCHRVDVATTPLDEAAPFEVVSCLHVLDRCARPLSLVDALLRALAPSGRLVVAVTLPYAPHVHVGPRTVDPDERLPCGGERWAEDLAALVSGVLEPRGLRVDRFTRAPYVSAGDPREARYVLDSAIVVCARASGAEGPRA